MKRNIAAGLVAGAIVVGGAVGWGVSRIDRHDNLVATGNKVPVNTIKIIDFRSGPNKQGLGIYSTSAVSKLTGTSAAFKQFVAANVERITLANKNICPTAAAGFSINKYSTAGYALGAVSDCGGYGAIWGVRGGVWKELIGTQDMWHCADLKKYSVPKALLDEPKCYDATTRKVVTYAD